MAPSDAVFVALLLMGLLRTAVAAPAPESAPATPSPAATPPTQPPKPAAPASPTRTRIGASASGHLTFGAAPEALPGIAISLMAELDRGGTWSPALFVGASRTWRNELPQAGASADFALDAASLDACPLRWRFWVAVARPCAVALVGRMTASGGGTDAPVSATRPFALAGAALTASFGKMVELTTRLAVGVTLIRDSYELGGEVFYRAGPITTTFSLGFGKSWP